MTTLLRVLCAAIFLLDGVILLEAMGRTRAPVVVTDTEPAQPFIVNYVDLTVSNDGSITQTGNTTRYVKADGEWIIERRRADGHTMSVGAAAYGVVSDQTIQQLYRSHNYLRTHPEFVRNDEVAGLKVYVFRIWITNTSSPGEWQERSYSPKTGLSSLRTVLHMRDGSEFRQEAVSVDFKDVEATQR